MRIGRTDRFKRSWDRLDETDKKLARKAIEKLAKNLKYPSLNVKKMRGTGNIWEARASRTLRITFEMASEIIILRNIGKHDDALKQP